MFFENGEKNLCLKKKKAYVWTGAYRARLKKTFRPEGKNEPVPPVPDSSPVVSHNLSLVTPAPTCALRAKTTETGHS